MSQRAGSRSMLLLVATLLIAGGVYVSSSDAVSNMWKGYAHAVPQQTRGRNNTVTFSATWNGAERPSISYVIAGLVHAPAPSELTDLPRGGVFNHSALYVNGQSYSMKVIAVDGAGTSCAISVNGKVYDTETIDAPGEVDCWINRVAAGS